MPDRVLLTGISGFLGGHVALQLLEAGYAVRGSVRDLKRADKVRQTLERAGADTSRLEFVALDLMSDKGWAEAMDGVRYVQHVASPFVTSMPADKMDLIRPAVEGTTRALEAAFAAKVERIVLTSSMAAVMYGHPKSRTRRSRRPTGPISKAATSTPTSNPRRGRNAPPGRSPSGTAAPAISPSSIRAPFSARCSTRIPAPRRC